MFLDEPIKTKEVVAAMAVVEVVAEVREMGVVVEVVAEVDPTSMVSTTTSNETVIQETTMVVREEAAGIMAAVMQVATTTMLLVVLKLHSLDLLVVCLGFGYRVFLVTNLVLSKL
ncbi:hypothetical protein CTI12_AA078340 [Artemisia annua]|uniref:Uncharacterized protein n=1 Tax=Artemisia annua TaxID=35608 RepID=A0A2U1Q3K0_ARTAN|nr:hypothetical protein CTI12_AA078340 [Artemisia annua]